MNAPVRSQLILPPELMNARTLLRRVASEAIAPDPELYVSDWADRNRRLSSKASAEAGPWQTDRTPYLREIMNVMSLSHPCTDADFMKGTQIGGSEALYNALGYVIDQAPCPAMLVMPTTDTAKRISRQRLQPMLEETPALAKKVAEHRSRDASSSMLMKDFPGGYLVIVGANSGPGLRSTPARVLLMDEVDAYPDDVDGEGDPCAVAEKRTDTFSRAKRIGCSSPKIKGKSRIERRYNRGSRGRYYVPCPHCAHEQYLRWEQVRWEMEKRREHACGACGSITELVDGEQLATCGHCQAPAQADKIRTIETDDVAEAWYQCEACGERIDEHHKTAILARGRHIHEQPGIGEVLADDDPHPHAIWAWVGGQVRRYLPRFRRPLSWQISALYSPLGWFSWRKAVTQFLEAQKGGYNEETGETLLQVFYNTVLGMPYEVPGEQPQESILKLRAEPYELGQVPAGALILTAAVDVQGDRLEVKVKGWGRGRESWLVDYHRIYYPVGAKKPTAETWAEVLKIRERGYPHAGGGTVRIAAMAIDSGYLSHEVYAFCRTYARQHIFATKGVPQRGKAPLGRPKAQDVNFDGKVLKDGVQLWAVGVDNLKDLVYHRLGIDEPGPGYMHFPRGMPDDYYDGLTAEKVVRKRVKGAEVLEWVKVRERNEPLDLEVLCEAAAIYAQVPRMTAADWDRLEGVINPLQQDLFTNNPSPRAASAPVQADARPAPAAPAALIAAAGRVRRVRAGSRI